MKSEYKDELLKYYGKNDLNTIDIQNVREIFKESGSYDKSVILMNNLFLDAKEALLKIKMNKEYRNVLLGFVSYLEERKK